MSIIHFKAEDVVQNLKGDIEALVPNYRDVIRTIQKELMEPVVTGTSKDVTTQTIEVVPHPLDTTQYRIGQPSRGIGAGYDHDWDPNRNPLAIGRSDLDPFSSGGGMLFNPFGRRGRIEDLGAGIPGGIPRGSVPPGARFDPFGPRAGTEPRRGGTHRTPDADHLPPPGYDDMFM